MIAHSHRVRRGPMFLPLLTLPLLLIGHSIRAGQDRAPVRSPDKAPATATADRLFARDNLIAWCIVPFDSKKRGPEERAAMLERLGFRHFAYDWRAEHIPTFDAEIDALKRHGVSLDAFWVAPGELNRESRIILDVLKRHGVKAQLWVLLDLGGDRVTGAEQERRVAAATAQLRPLAEEAGKIGCSLALYNHGGWFGEPENQLAIIERLRKQGISNVGIVYNLHHGHDHLDRFAGVLAKIEALPCGDQPQRDGPGRRPGRAEDPAARPGVAGPGAAADHPRQRLPRADRHPRPHPGRRRGAARATTSTASTGSCLSSTASRPARDPDRARPCRPGPRPARIRPTPRRSSTLLADARAHGDPGRGAAVFASPKFACVSCHRVGGQGGTVGPDLTTAGACIKPEEIVESVLWPGRKVKEGYEAVAVATADGRVVQGYKQAETAR